MTELMTPIVVRECTLRPFHPLLLTPVPTQATEAALTPGQRALKMALTVSHRQGHTCAVTEACNVFPA